MGRLQTRSNSAQLTLVGFSPAVRRFDELPVGKSPLPKERIPLALLEGH